MFGKSYRKDVKANESELLHIEKCNFQWLQCSSKGRQFLLFLHLKKCFSLKMFDWKIFNFVFWISCHLWNILVIKINLKSVGVKSEYGGCGTIFYPSNLVYSWVCFAKCALALSYWRIAFFLFMSAGHLK